MENLQKVMMAIYDNRHDYKEIDYIVMMNILKENYLRLSGDLPILHSTDEIKESLHNLGNSSDNEYENEEVLSSSDEGESTDEELEADNERYFTRL